ncbi:ocs element-binding factor 1-like [Phalaenopsis equestris]|uniref:ocs element-binding factor 1-like n=1 Tax=Phalaenopsis equestris TaxID=78828 RepID=UPI0009E494B0|nr:ocs element-binding factor 1-like [Phalaenopsis equestris]
MDCSTANINFTMKSSADDRRLRRMISNRESARRSRMRKQRHLEDLRSRVGRLRLENSAVAERIAAISCRCTVISHENKLFKAEAAALSRRLFEIRQLLFLRQLDCLSSLPALVSVSSSGGGVGVGTGYLGSTNEQSLASLMA